MTKATAVAALFKAAQAIPHLLAPGETVEEWNERVHMIVEQNYEAAGDYANGKGWTRFELAIATTVLEGNETRFDRRIHAGEKHPIWTQDDGLATCLGQHHVSKAIPAEDWARLAGLGLDATARCARATTMMLVSHAKQCGVFIGQRASKNAVAKAMASYGSGGKCTPNDEMWRRGSEWEKLMGKFGPLPDMPGYHRARTGEVPQSVADVAREYLELADKEHLNTVHALPEFAGGERFKIRIERHAGGKIGVSIFMKDGLE